MRKITYFIDCNLDLSEVSFYLLKTILKKVLHVGRIYFKFIDFVSRDMKKTSHIIARLTGSLHSSIRSYIAFEILLSSNFH